MARTTGSAGRGAVPVVDTSIVLPGSAVDVK
jgi:hypothetical protein